ncbi:TorF family putative porin [Candidatus Methylomicrobium oryzae]|jgi:uncharacterized protein (TIGR02001 family)|uniref:TorF family putative porin n=1 Tax=Candidatus Methylomicrobium oryzae TaxID=2802053 RepID=UPI001920BFC7|nr:TorF family putative porin [Methylomicrobium sp. RS1]MBL1265269.1 hypothetical protein [Methylomicrobium sp. RS1]
MTSTSTFLLRAACLFLAIWPQGVLAEWHGDLKFLTDYIYRGYSKSRGHPVAQAHVDYQGNAGWFAGLGVSQVRFDDQIDRERAEIEVTPYLGWSLPLSSDWRAEFSVSGYLYDGKIFGRNPDYAEIYASLHYRDWLSVRASIAPDAYQRGADVLNYELSYRRDLWDNLQFSSGLGYHQAGALLGHDYFYWNAGLSWFATSYLAIDLRYVDVDLSSPHEAEDHPPDQFYPRQQDHNYLFSIILGF